MFTRLILERPLALVIAWMFCQVALIGIWSWRRSKPTAKAVWAGFCALPLAMAVNLLVVTDREQVIALCRELAEAVERADVSAIASRLESAFQADGLDRDAFIHRVTQTFERYAIQDVRLREFEVNLGEGRSATVEFAASCYVRSSDILSRPVFSAWRLQLVRRGSGWGVAGIKLLPRPLSPIRSLSDWP